MNVSCAVIATVLNESGSIDDLLTSLAEQTRSPDQVVVVDGGSTDGTLERLLAWRGRLALEVMSLPGSNIAQGRNAAIRAAREDVIAVTDAGVRLSPAWLAELLAPFESESPPDVVSGFFRADWRSPFELAMGATVLPERSEVDPARFLPSSRSVAFRKAAWEHVGGYPEWLDFCEDLVFDLRLKQLGFAFGWAPEALVHFRPRSSLSAFFRQYFLYARGDGKAGLWPWRHAARYAAYIFAALTLLSARNPLLMLLLASGGVAYVRRPYARLLPALKGQPRSSVVQAAALVPLIRVVGDVAKMLGYPIGLRWRAARRSRRESPGTEPR
jgi:glycosyltransferase involved in cell wall biosynthesis